MYFTAITLISLGLVAFALSAPSDDSSSTTGLIAIWENTQAHMYHCGCREVVCCETIAGGRCSTIDFCEAYCLNHDNGASCVNLNTPVANAFKSTNITVSKAMVSVPEMNVAARDALPQENKHYACSRNRASVLICRYGFCSTDYYCRSGNECKDECNCCKSAIPPAQRIKPEVRAVPIQSEDVAISIETRGRSSKVDNFHVCSKDRASVLKCTYDFCSIDYYCAKRHPCVDNPARCSKAINTRK